MADIVERIDDELDIVEPVKELRVACNYPKHLARTIVGDDTREVLRGSVAHGLEEGEEIVDVFIW